MKYFFILFLFFLISSCSSNKDKKVDLEIFKKQGEKINIFESSNTFDKEITYGSTLKLNQPLINKKWIYEHYSSNNFYDHFFYDGKLEDIYKKNVGDYINVSNDNGSLLVFDNFIFISDETGVIYKFDLTTKKVIWEINVHNNSFKNYPQNISLFLNDDVLFASDNLGFIYSIDVNSGKILWLQNYGIPFSSHLNFYKGILYVVNQNSRLYAFNASDGLKIWSFEALSGVVKPSKSSNISIDNDKLIFSNDLGDITVIDLNKQTVLWSINILSTNRIFNNFFLKISNILIDKNQIFVSSNGGDLLNFNIENGQINWFQKISSIQNHLISDKFLFVLTEEGFIIAYNKLDGNLLWSFNLAKFSNAKPKQKIHYYGLVLASNKLIATSSDGFIYKISANNGEYILHKKINNDLSRAPIVADNKIFILNRSSELLILN